MVTDRSGNTVQVTFIENVVDCIRMYADSAVTEKKKRFFFVILRRSISGANLVPVIWRKRQALSILA
ncbi:hypothetical protein CSA56_18270 [candidate division KSB3 bacterium]|uniref:Uncharacterized protein n=1 Tax=candidate division KSB3 bacterium TaxID=2044937 RepID=A0A2G6K725_9BACT|nr:MAG: hypothetical protein CSA56_18270 [candidate division KSB3 bacterium]